MFPPRGGVEGGGLSIPPTASHPEALRPRDAELCKGKPRAASGSCFNPRAGGPGVPASPGPPRPAFCLLAIREARGPRRPALQEIAQLLGSRRRRGPRSPAAPRTAISRPDQQHHFQGLQTGSPPASSCLTAPPPVSGGPLVCGKVGPTVPGEDSALSQLARPQRLHGRPASRPRACPAGPCRRFSLRSFPSCCGLGPRAGGGRQLSRHERRPISASPAASLAVARAARTARCPDGGVGARWGPGAQGEC